MYNSRIEKKLDPLNIETQKKWGLIYDEPCIHTSHSEIPSKDIDFEQLFEGNPFYIHESIQGTSQKKRIIFAEWYLSETTNRIPNNKELLVYEQLLTTGFEFYVLTAKGFIQVHSLVELKTQFAEIAVPHPEYLKNLLSEKGWYEFEIFILNADFLSCIQQEYQFSFDHNNEDATAYLQTLANPIIEIDETIDPYQTKSLLPNLSTLNLTKLEETEQVKAWISIYPKIKKLKILSTLPSFDIFHEEKILSTLEIFEIIDTESADYNELDDEKLIKLLSHTPNISEFSLYLSNNLKGSFIEQINLPKLKCLYMTLNNTMNDTHMENLLGRFSKLEQLKIISLSWDRLLQEWPLRVDLPCLEYLEVHNGVFDNLLKLVLKCNSLKDLHLSFPEFIDPQINIEGRLDGLETLILDNFELDENNQIQLEIFFSKLTNLKKLVISPEISERASLLPSIHNQKLTLIKLRGMPLHSSELVTMISNNPQLKKLQMDFCKLKGELRFEKQHPNLKKISLHRTDLSRGKLKSLFSACPNIETLQITTSDRENYSPPLPQLIGNKLRVLTLINCRLSAYQLGELHSNHPDLETLELIQCKLKEDFSFINQHQKIKIINMDLSPINTQQLLALIQACPNLQLIQFKRPKSSKIKHIIERYPNIKFICSSTQKKETSDPGIDIEIDNVNNEEIFTAPECITPETNTVENPDEPLTGRELIENLPVNSYRINIYQYNSETESLNLIKPPEKLPALELTPIPLEAACKRGQLPLKNIQAGIWYPLTGISPYDEFHSVSVFDSNQRFVTDFCLGYYEVNRSSYIKFGASCHGQSVTVHQELTPHATPANFNPKKRNLKENLSPRKKPRLSVEQKPQMNSETVLISHEPPTDDEIKKSLSNPECLSHVSLPAKLNALIRFCKKFGSGELGLPENASSAEKMDQSTLKQFGSCLTRSMVFARFCARWGLECYVIGNDVHAFVEVFMNDLYQTLDLGGFDAALTIKPIAAPKPVVPFIRKKETFNSLDSCLAKIDLCDKPALVVVPESSKKIWITEMQVRIGRKMMLIKPENIRFNSIKLEVGNQKPTDTESELALFLESDEPVYLVIDFSDFKASYIPLYTALGDGDERKLAQKKLSRNIKPIILFPEHLSSRMRGDFWSRFHQATFHATNYQPTVQMLCSEQSPAIRELEEYDLYGSNTFESLLTGTFEIDETGCLKPVIGALLQAIQDNKTGLVINHSPRSQAFHKWITALNTRRTLFFNGKSHEIPQDFEIILKDTPYDLTSFNYSISNNFKLLLNNTFFDLNNANLKTYIKSYRVNEQTNGLCKQKSFFETYKNQHLCFWVTEVLPVSEIYRLIMTAAQYKISLSFFGTEAHLKPFVNARHTLVTPGTEFQSPYFIKTTDATFWLHNFAPGRKFIPVNINTTYEDLVCQIKVKQKEKFNFEFKLQKGILAHNLLSEEAPEIILAGSINAQLAARLSTAWLPQPYLWLNGERKPFKGHLIVVSENSLEALPFIPSSHHCTSADFYLSLLRTYPHLEKTAQNIKTCITLLEQQGLSFNFRRLELVFKAAKNNPSKNPFRWILKFEKNAHQLLQATNIYFSSNKPTILKEINTNFSKSGTNTRRMLKALVEEQFDEPMMEDLVELSENIPPFNASELDQFDNRLCETLQKIIGMPKPDINQKRLKKLANAFSIHRVAFLLGTTGVGKSYFMENTLKARYEVFILDKENPKKTIIEWLTSKSHKPKVLVSDEVNLIPQNILEQLADIQNNAMLVDGDLYELKDHFALLAGNPPRYRNRQHHQFFDEICTLEFKPLSTQDLYSLIVKPILKNERTACTFWDNYKIKSSFPTKTPRDIAQKAHRFLVKQGRPNNTLSIFKSFNQQNPGLSITKAWESLLTKLQLDMEERLYQLQHGTTLGKSGILIEGGSALGKTSFISALLRLNEIDFIDLTGKSVSEMKALLKNAFHEGRVVLIDEINTMAPLFEWELNHYMEGKDGNKNRAKNPGFFVIGTLNPPGEFNDRTPLSPALENRFVKRYVAPHTAEDLRAIFQIRGKSEIEAEQLALSFIEGLKLDPTLTLRDMGL